MSSVGQRILEFINESGIMQKDFCEKAGISPPYLSQIKHGKHNPSFDMINKILNAYPELNRTWLLKGTGEMLNTLKGIENIKLKDTSMTQVPTPTYQSDNSLMTATINATRFEMLYEGEKRDTKRLSDENSQLRAKIEEANKRIEAMLEQIQESSSTSGLGSLLDDPAKLTAIIDGVVKLSGMGKNNTPAVPAGGACYTGNVTKDQFIDGMIEMTKRNDERFLATLVLVINEFEKNPEMLFQAVSGE